MPYNFSQIVATCGLITQNQLTDSQIHLLANNAHLEEVETRTWARLQRDITVNSFALYTTGTVTTTQASPLVTGVGTGWTSAMIGMSFRAGITTPSGPATQYSPVRIDSVQSATQLTLATAYPNVSGVNQGYQIFPLTYSALGFQRIVEVRQQVKLGQRTHGWFNQRDPYRINLSSPSVFWAPFGQDADGNARFELWPVETVSQGYTVFGVLGHRDLRNPTDLPLLPATVIINKTLMKCFETLYSLTGDQRWISQRDFYANRYNEEFQKAIDADREEFGVIGQVQDSIGDPNTSGSTPGIDQFAVRDVIG